MLALLGTLAVVTLLMSLMFNWCSPIVALIAVPVAAALLGGFGMDTATFIVSGISTVAPVAGMFIFAIFYFGIMTDAGLTDPVIGRILRIVGRRPTRIVVGSALLALLIHLNGSGAVCFLVTIPAMLPIYDKLGMDRRVLACVAALASGVNFLPWAGVTLRASTVLHLQPIDIIRPMLGVQAVGLMFVFGTAYILGRREERRLGLTGATTVAGDESHVRVLTAEHAALRRPHLFWMNAMLTLVLLTIMITGIVKDAVVVFMIGTAIALVVNYPNPLHQRERIDAHAKAAMLMAGVLFASGAFTGIMSKTGMLTAMAEAGASHIPAEIGPRIPIVLALIAMPLSLVFDPDSYYLGVLPVVARVAQEFGIEPVQVAQASLLGQHTVGYPVSPLTPATFLLVGLCGLELRDHQRFTIPYAYAVSVLMTLTAVAIGLFSF